MMGWTASQTYRFTFQTLDSSGDPADADALPTGTLYVNGASTASIVTITDAGAGWYRGSVSLTGRSVGDVFEVEVSATIGGTVYLMGMGVERIDVSVNSRHPNAAVTVTGQAPADFIDNLAIKDGAISQSKIEIDAITADQVAAGALDYKGNWNIGRTGYSLTPAERTSIATAVWSSATRTLTSFGTLVADIWANLTRTLTAGTKDTEIDAIKAKTDQLAFNGADVQATLDGEEVTTDVASRLASQANLTQVNADAAAAKTAAEANQTKLDAMTEDDGGTPRFTANTLEQAPAGGGGGGSGDATEAKQNEIISKLSGATIVVFDPIQGSTIKLVRGDDYTSDGLHGPLTFPVDHNSTPLQAGDTVTLTVRDDYSDADVLTKAGSVVNAGAVGQAVRFEIADADTQGLSVAAKYKFDIQITQAGKDYTPFLGEFILLEDQTRD